ncbi:MAG TPA: aldo/keto reductase [Terracidiphilus sp.]|jgi:aryl-alcohol dehydrogenase-like predicted oxidoreductase
METRNLKHTDLQVSRLCLGTMTFGKPVSQDDASRMVDLCLEAGINCIDTANMYQLGVAEELLGVALKGKRDRVVLSTKVRMKMGEGPDESGLSKRAIHRAVEDSLRRLQTDFVDIYYLHQPDYDVAIEETLEAIESLVKEGKVRYPGTSNYASWQVVQMLDIACAQAYKPAFIAQPMYNLLARGIEQEFLPMAKAFGVSTFVYNPLAAGLLTGKHRETHIPEGGRFDKNRMYQDRYWNSRTFEALNQLKTISSDLGRSLLDLAFAWLLHHTASDVVILGASSIEQLTQNLTACKGGPIPEAAISRFDEVWQEFRGPVPFYNR